MDNRYGADLEAGYALLPGLDVQVKLHWVSRRTNYPDYEPGVFPASRQYSIVWSYDNFAVTAGVSYQASL